MRGLPCAVLCGAERRAIRDESCGVCYIVNERSEFKGWIDIDKLAKHHIQIERLCASSATLCHDHTRHMTHTRVLGRVCAARMVSGWTVLCGVRCVVLDAAAR